MLPEGGRPRAGTAEPRTSAPVILLVDDHELLTTGLTYMLLANGFSARRVQVTDVPGILAEASGHVPGVVLLDLGLGVGSMGNRIDGVELIAPLCELGWAVLVMTGSDDQDHIAAAIARGARNWILKTADFSRLVRVVSEVAHGRGFLPNGERDAMIARHEQNDGARRAALTRIRRLTAREKAVLDRLVRGATASTIADESFTSLGTVRTHIRSILAKLEVNSQIAAVAIAHHYHDSLGDAPDTPVARTATAG